MAEKYKISVTRTEKSRLPQIDFKNIPFGKEISDHMFVADYDGKEWTDLRIVPFQNFEMSPANLALHYGQSFFEGMKASKCNGEPTLLRPEMHSRRLNASAERMCMPAFPEKLFIKAIKMLVDLDRDWIPEDADASLYIRPMMYANDSGYKVSPSITYRLVIFTGPVGPYYAAPVKLWVEEVFTRAAQGGPGEAKCAGNYGAALLPAMRARQAGYDQVLWMDANDKKYIQEVGTMNILFVMDNKVITPVTTGTILRGITRDTFLILLKEWGYTVEDRLVSIAEVADAYWRGALQECFGAGTAAVVSPVSNITWRNISMDIPVGGPVATRLKAYIESLRSGKEQDTHNWLVSCDNSGVWAALGETVEMAV